MSKKTAVFAALAIMFAALLWALDGEVFTPWILDLGLRDIPTIVLMLHLTASIFLSYFLITERRELAHLQRQDWLAFLLTGLFGGAIGTMAIVAAIFRVHAADLNISVVLILQKTQPVFAILLALLWLRERPRRIFYGWVLLALVGSYFLTFSFTAVHFDATGMLIPGLLSLLAAFSFGSSTVFSKKAVTKISHGLGTSLRFLMTVLVMLVILVVIALLNRSGIKTGYAGFSAFPLINYKLMLLFILIALTTGGTAIFIYYWGLKRVTATRSTIYELMFPVSALVLEYFIHHQVLGAGQWVGAVLILLAIIGIMRLKNKYETAVA